MPKRFFPIFATVSGLALVAFAAPAVAQEPGEEPERESVRTDVTPYLEFDQVVVAGFGDGDGVLTYSTVAAGIDAQVSTRRAQGQVSLRYERTITYDDRLDDTDYISGLARGAVTVAPGLSFDAGALATRSRIDSRGAAPTNLVANPDNVSQVYSAYAGPTFGAQVGDVTVGAAYRFGYTKVEADDDAFLGGQPPIDTFDESTSHVASASVGQQPGGVLPFGWAIGGGYEREDAGQLDQRFEQVYARADVTVPISPTLAVVGGAGYENIEISERDALRDANDDPVRDDDGRLVVDPSSPRLLAYDQDGFIWDVGVLWRPSRRTSLEARVGRRYGSTTYIGSLSYQPDERSVANIGVYDTVTGFGSLLNDNLSALPTEFTAFRNPLTGDLNSCAFGAGGGLCFDDALQSAASAAFRSRGVTASYSTELSGWKTGLALGYNRRSFITSDLGARAQLDGVVDQAYFANAYIARSLDAVSSFQANLYANYFDPGFSGSGDVFAIGANAGYNRQLWRGLDATAALGVDYYDQQGFLDDDEVTASALLGLRYSF